MNITDEQEQSVLKDVGHPHELFKIPGVTAYYPGLKTVEDVSTKQECLVVCVAKKKPLNSLNKTDVVPRFINNTLTDVVELPQQKIQVSCTSSDATNPYDPTKQGCITNIYTPTGALYSDAPGGLSIGLSNDMSAGTVGIMVTDKDTRRVMALTCNHVVGLHVYDPPRGKIAKTYEVLDDGFTFRIRDPKYNATYTKPIFGDQFPPFVSGVVYGFKVLTDLHEFYITRNPGGGSLDPVTTVTITNSAGEVRFAGGIGPGGPVARLGETLYFDNNDGDEQVYYGSYNFPNVGNKIQLVATGIPPCTSVNRNKYTKEYTDGILADKHRSIIGRSVAYPSNLDAEQGNQVLYGKVIKSQPIMFCHPNNEQQPINKVDAAVIDLNTESIQAKAGVISLSKKPIRAAKPRVGAHVFKSGRTTGLTPQGTRITPDNVPYGYSNPCVIKSASATVTVNYCGAQDTVQKTAIFEDCILYEQQNEWFSTIGDSGSALLMRDTSDGNKLKHVGIHMTGGAESNNNKVTYSWGVACNIQNILTQLNLEIWEGTVVVDTDVNCIKIDGVCYERREPTTSRATHTSVDVEYDNCDKCRDD